MPFGLCNAPANWQRFINETLMDYLNDFAAPYVDDILIGSRDDKEHQRHLELFLQRLHDKCLHADIDKCKFFADEVKYLGLIISSTGIKMDPDKVKAIAEWPKPAPGDLKAIRRFLGFVNFYHRFIKDFSKIARPLNNLLKKNAGR